MKAAVVLSARIGLVAAGMLPLAGCTSERREAASLVSAVDRYRQAEMGVKGGLVEAIAAVPCSAPETCGAKEACLAAARPTVKGAALKAEVERALGDLHAGRITQDEAASRELPQKLDTSSRLFDEGRAKIGACDAQITALRLKYGL